MEVLERCLRDERSLCLRMKEEEGKFLVNGGLEVAHGRATVGMSRANFLDFWWIWFGKGRHGPCQVFGLRGFKKFSFSRIMLGQLPTKQLKTKKNKQNKSN